MRIIQKAVGTWSFIAAGMRAAVYIPFGLALLAIAGWLVWDGFDDWLNDIAAAWLVYQGGKFVFGSLESFAGRPKNEDRSQPNGIRRPNP